MDSSKSKLSTVRSFRKASSPYAASKLQESLLKASNERMDNEFAIFQVNWMKKHIPEFNADAFSVIHCQMDGNQMIAGAHNALFMNISPFDVCVLFFFANCIFCCFFVNFSSKFGYCFFFNNRCVCRIIISQMNNRLVG